MEHKAIYASILIVVAVSVYQVWKRKNQIDVWNKRVIAPTSAEEFNILWDDAGNRLKPLIMIGEAQPKTLNSEDEKNIRYSIKELEACLLYKKDHWASMVFIAKGYQALGEDNKAFNSLISALKIEKNNHVIYKEASLQAVKLGDMEKAIEYSKEALRIKPNDPELLGNYSMNLLITKQDDQARSTIQKALEIAPNDQFNQKLSRVINDVASGKRKRPTPGKWEG